MTIEERKRAKLLEKVSIVYSANKSGTLVAVLMAILLAVLDLTLYFFGFKDEYTADLLIVHNLMVFLWEYLQTCPQTIWVLPTRTTEQFMLNKQQMQI